MKYLRESRVLQPMRVAEKRKSVVGAFKPFNRDIYKRDLLTPHREMEKVLDALEQSTIFASASETAKNFIIGEGLDFESDHEFSKKEVEIYWNGLHGDLALNDGVLKTIAAGNGYLEKDFYDPIKTRGILVPSKLYSIPDPSQIYINCNEYGDPLKKDAFDKFGNKVRIENNQEFYVQKIQRAARHPNARQYDISYYGGGALYTGSRLQIYGIPIDKRKIVHFKLNLGPTSLYGRSLLASALNDHQMLFEIERAIATIAKHKAVPRKVWQYGDPNMPASSDELDEFLVYVESLEMEDDIITNKPFATTDLSYAGKEIRLDYAIDHIKRKQIAGVSLDFLSGMGQDVNRSTAQQELLAFILSIYAKRRIFLRIIQNEIIDPYIKWKGLKPVKVKFSELDFETKSEKENRVRSNWQANMVTFNEMREEMGYPKFNVSRQVNDMGDMLFGEVQMQMMPSMDSIGGGFDAFGNGGFESLPPPIEEPDNGSLGNALNAPRAAASVSESIKPDPTGTKMLRQKFAIQIRRVFNERLNKIMQYIDQNRITIEKCIRTEATLGIETFDTILKLMEGISGDLQPAVMAVLSESWLKANSDIARKLKKDRIPYDVRYATALQKNALGFLNKHAEDQSAKLRMILSEGMSQGDSITDIKKEIRKNFNLTRSKSELIARTETIRTYNQAAFQSMKEAGVKQYKWLTAGDSRVCLEHCQPKAGRVFELGKGPMPVKDTHPNCRCSISPHVDLKKMVGEKLIIYQDNESDGKDERMKEISFQTLMEKFNYIFNEPLTTEVFYKKDNANHIISFMKDALMVKCIFTDQDILEYVHAKENTNADEKKQIIQAWLDQHLKNAVHEVQK